MTTRPSLAEPCEHGAAEPAAADVLYALDRPAEPVLDGGPAELLPRVDLAHLLQPAAAGLQRQQRGQPADGAASLGVVVVPRVEQCLPSSARIIPQPRGTTTSGMRFKKESYQVNGTGRTRKDSGFKFRPKEKELRRPGGSVSRIVVPSSSRFSTAIPTATTNGSRCARPEI